eukprot:scaffold251958_cov38-Tisochrysis_lutea.AAC.3
MNIRWLISSPSRMHTERDQNQLPTARSITMAARTLPKETGFQLASSMKCIILLHHEASARQGLSCLSDKLGKA